MKHRELNIFQSSKLDLISNEQYVDAALVDVEMRPFHDFLRKLSYMGFRQLLQKRVLDMPTATMLTVRVGWTHR